MQKTITHLEMTDPAQLKVKFSAEAGFEVRRAEVPDYRLNRFFYQWVGKDYRWTDRLVWSDEQWQQVCEAPHVHLLIASLQGTPVGYCEVWQHGSEMELKLFGLADRYLGRGLGGHFLTLCIQQAWQLGASRVFLNTCDWDHPHALKNYLARGFQVCRTEVV